MLNTKTINCLHKVMRYDPMINEISGSIDVSAENFEERMNDLLLQMNIDTATWALEVYEREHGIVTELAKPLEERRSVVKSKMRGSGKLTATQIKVVADAFTNGNVSVSFEEKIQIEFNSVIGTPPNMDDLKKALEEVKPAHLAINYNFRYLLISDVSKMTIAEIEKTTLSNFGGGAFG